jgi:predicted nucleotidyltransferase
MQAARAAAAVLHERFGAERVRAFGSLLRPAAFNLRSDIDLAVEGIDPLLLLKAWSAASAVAPGFEFDLVIPEECRPAVWAAVEAEGIDL